MLRMLILLLALATASCSVPFEEETRSVIVVVHDFYGEDPQARVFRTEEGADAAMDGYAHVFRVVAIDGDAMVTPRVGTPVYVLVMGKEDNPCQTVSVRTSRDITNDADAYATWRAAVLCKVED